MARPLNIACLQIRPMPDFASALDEALPMAASAVAAGANFLVLPEYCGGLASAGSVLRPPSAPESAHAFLQGFIEFAARQQVWLMLGSIAVDGPEGKILNRGIVIDDQGSIHSRYDKIHLFDVQLSASEVYQESASVGAGSQAVVFDTPFGRMGHTICYDLRFPHLYRALAQAGAEIICIPAAFVKTTGKAHWHVLNRARAIENGVFIVAPCAIGDISGGGSSYGHSLIVNPWGEIVADAGDSTGVIHVDIDLDEVKAARARIPSLNHDRPFSITDINGRNVA